MSTKIACRCLCALAISSLLLVSCSKDESETIYTPSLTLTSTAVVATVDGGNYSFGYTVTNPAEDGIISATTSADWITDLYDTGSSFSFTVAANSGNTRTGRISVSYVSSYGTLSQIFTVVQNSGEAPVLSVQPTAVTATAEGGNCSFSYTIENPLEGGELYCSTTVDWISGLKYSTTDERGNVTFDVAANETGSLRQADIIVSYSSDYGILEQTVAVVQDHSSSCGGGGDTGDFEGDITDLIGTYTAHGMAYVDAGVAGETTWTMKIYASSVSGFDVFIDGLVPGSADSYPETEAYIAKAYLDASGRLVIPTQLTGYTNTATGLYIGWTPCVAYDELNGWSYSRALPSTTLTYDSSTETWTSDYGEFLSLFTVTSSYQIDTFQGFFDVVNPGFTITKTSSSTSSLTSDGVVSHPIDEHLVLHKDFHLAK